MVFQYTDVNVILSKRFLSGLLRYYAGLFTVLYSTFCLMSKYGDSPGFQISSKFKLGCPE